MVTNQPIQIPFQPGPTASPKDDCSYNQCSSGHKWPPTIKTSHCPSDSTPLVALRLEQCPICNEPTILTVLRIDHIPTGASISSPCQGQINHGVTTHFIELDHKPRIQQTQTQKTLPPVQEF